ncbi:MAG: YceI family protein [Pseudomonadota bacterium]
MNARQIFCAATITLLALSGPPAAAQSLAPGTYNVVPERSAASLTLRSPLGPVKAELQVAEGTIVVGNGGRVREARTVMDAQSVYTSTEAAVDLIRGRSGLHIERFPTITFEASNMVINGDNVRVRGSLTVKGNTRPVSFTGELLRANDRRFSVALQGKIDRTAFGVTAGRPLYSKDATVRLRIIARKRR